MSASLRIVTWNIAGGHKSKSNQRFDYEKDEDALYFVNELQLINPDIICLQESHWHPDKSLSIRLARSLGYEYVYETVNSPSGIDPKYKESMAIISRHKLENTSATTLPYPAFEMYLPNGEPAAQWDKHLQIAYVDGIQIANIHTQPLGYFKFDYHTGQGATYARELEKILLSELRKPLILAGDMNMVNVDQVFTELFNQAGLHDALSPDTGTKHNGHHVDYILYSNDLTTNDSGIVQTSSDHFLCWAEVAKHVN
jgi:endonuclease/exonuclease/phosphatase family metal-dependent hydrolase